MLTLALSSWSFHRHLAFHNTGPWSPPREDPELPVLDFPKLSASYGIFELELCQMHLASQEPNYLAGVRTAVEDAGCRVINMPIDVGNLAVEDAGGPRNSWRLSSPG
jgi:hypothetical protein